MLVALLATPAGLHNCQTCWVHSVRLHDPGQPPTGNLSGTTSYQGLGEADMPLGALLQSYFA